MEYDTFFSSQRWAILDIIARKPDSPVAISEKMRTSVSYVSQQLKLLEAAGIVVKSKTGVVDKGKPRLIYSIKKEVAHIAFLAKGQPEKKMMDLDDHHKIILNIWMLEKKLHKILERFYWKVEDDLKDVVGIFIVKKEGKACLYFVSDSKKLILRSESYLKGVKDVFDYKIYSGDQFKKIEKNNLHSIYDPFLMLMDENNLKGGIENKDEKQLN